MQAKEAGGAEEDRMERVVERTTNHNNHRSTTQQHGSHMVAMPRLSVRLSVCTHGRARMCLFLFVSRMSLNAAPAISHRGPKHRSSSHTGWAAHFSLRKCCAFLPAEFAAHFSLQKCFSHAKQRLRSHKSRLMNQGTSSIHRDAKAQKFVSYWLGGSSSVARDRCAAAATAVSLPLKLPPRAATIPARTDVN